MRSIVITKAQLTALLDYFDMYGVDSMQFDQDTIDETLNNFSPSEISLETFLYPGRFNVGTRVEFMLPDETMAVGVVDSLLHTPLWGGQYIHQVKYNGVIVGSYWYAGLKKAAKDG